MQLTWDVRGQWFRILLKHDMPHTPYLSLTRLLSRFTRLGRWFDPTPKPIHLNKSPYLVSLGQLLYPLFLNHRIVWYPLTQHHLLVATYSVTLGYFGAKLLIYHQRRLIVRNSACISDHVSVARPCERVYPFTVLLRCIFSPTETLTGPHLGMDIILSIIS